LCIEEKQEPETLQNQGARQVKRDIALKERIYLAVPYDERNEAKALGARWDAVKKARYVGPEVDQAKLSQWELRHQPESTLDPRAEFAAVLRSIGGIVDGDHPIMNGEPQRISAHDDKRDDRTIFYVAHVDGVPNGYAENNRTKRGRALESAGRAPRSGGESVAVGASRAKAIRAAPSGATDVRGNRKAPKRRTWRSGL
jgi:putative DNA primase/helicase